MSEIASPLKNLSNLDSHDVEPTSKHSRNQVSSPMTRSRNNFNDNTMKSTFVTNTYVGAKKGFEEKAKMDEVYNNHEKLNNLVDDLDDKVKTLLNENQTNFLMAYKEQMMHIQKELKMLKKKIDEETYKRKNDERMNILEQERDWFRAEAIRLDKVCKEQQKLLQEVKFKLKMTTEDKGYFEDFVLAAKKENKALKEELMQFELGKRVAEDLPGKNRNQFQKRSQTSDPSKKGRTPLRMSADLEGSEDNMSRMKGDDLGSIQMGQMNGYTNEEKLLEIIKQMKLELDKERRQCRQLRNEKSQILVKRIELEQILVESINEIKKEISKRRNAKLPKELNKGPHVPMEIDITKFTAQDKRNLMEYFLSNDLVLEEIYNLVFGNQVAAGQRAGYDKERAQLTSANTYTSNRSEAKAKFSFTYGFGSAGNLRIGQRDLNSNNMSAAVSQKAHNVMGEFKRGDKRNAEGPKKDL